MNYIDKFREFRDISLRIEKEEEELSRVRRELNEICDGLSEEGQKEMMESFVQYMEGDGLSMRLL